MSFWMIVTLAIVQGITEFLPVSSSAHLVLVPHLTGWQDQSLVVDVATHVGSLLAVILYFRGDCKSLIRGVMDILRFKWQGEAYTLAMQCTIATLPILLFGYWLKDTIAQDWRNLTLIGWTVLLFGLLLYWVDSRAKQTKKLTQMGFKEAIWIGVAQVLALIPGVSRSGITITAALHLGLTRVEAARFSMLLAIPTILGAGGLMSLELYQTGSEALIWDVIWAGGCSFVAATVAIWALMAWLRRSSMLPFVIYRIFLGGGLLLWAYG